MALVEAPWSEQQVDHLNEWQHAGYVHEFTCPNEHAGSHVLIALRNGWHCPGCAYTQTWAHEMMLAGPPSQPFNPQ